MGFVHPWARWTEDFYPGRPPDEVLEPQAWVTTDDSLTFGIVGDNGSGGRNAMDVARQMARAYEETPFGVVINLGDISYYGSIADRYEEVFVEPFRPLLDAGVGFELAVGNHELQEKPTEDANREIEARLEKLAVEGNYYSVVHGPVEFFMLDSSTPQTTGAAGPEQLAWFEEALAASDARWKVVALHHPLYSSGRHGSNLEIRELLEPLLVEHGVDLVLTGHDHDYERTTPQKGIVHVVSGGGSKLTDVGTSDFTAYSEKRLQFMVAEVEGDSMQVRVIDEKGEVFDEFEMEKGTVP